MTRRFATGGRREPGARDDTHRLLSVRRWTHNQTESTPMFLFFSNKLGWLGSILVSVIGSAALIGLLALFF